MRKPKLLPTMPAGIGPLKRLTRGIYAFVMLAIAIGVMIRPIGLPMRIDIKTQEFYNEIVALSPGDVVVWVDSTGFSGYTMIRDMYRAVAQFMASRGLKLIYVPGGVETPQNWRENVAYSRLEERFKYVNGVDFVVLGYLPGAEVAYATWRDSGFRALPVDAYGKSVESLPLMQLVRSFNDVKLIFIGAASFTLGQEIVRQWLTSFPHLRSIASLAYGGIALYYGKYIWGVLDGIRGYAEFEKLTGFLGSEVVSMDAKNLHIILWLAIMFALNIEFYWYKMKPKKVEAAVGR